MCRENIADSNPQAYVSVTLVFCGSITYDGGDALGSIYCNIHSKKYVSILWSVIAKIYSL